MASLRAGIGNQTVTSADGVAGDGAICVGKSQGREAGRDKSGSRSNSFLRKTHTRGRQIYNKQIRVTLGTCRKKNIVFSRRPLVQPATTSSQVVLSCCALLESFDYGVWVSFFEVRGGKGGAVPSLHYTGDPPRIRSASRVVFLFWGGGTFCVHAS
jgi:hypothetical protein